MEEKLYTKEYGEKIREIPPVYKGKIMEWLLPGHEDVILEIGSNKGELLDFLRKHAPHTFGSDLNQGILVETKKPNTLEADATKLPIKSASIDKSVSLHTIEHIPELGNVFQELDRATKEGGLSFHAFPSALIRGLDGALIDAWKMTHNPFKAFMIARQLHVHNLNPDRLKRFLTDTNWNLIESERVFVPEERGYSWMVLLQKTPSTY